MLPHTGAVWSQNCQRWTEARYDNTSDALDDPNKFPLGFRRANLPNFESMVPNPCFVFEVQDTNQYVEITVCVLVCVWGGGGGGVGGVGTDF